MSILNVNKINPVGGGSTITIAGITSVTSSISIASSCTATSYYGNGANLTGIDLGAVTGATGDFSIADKIVHTGDTNTAIRFPAADTFSVETGGSERIRIGSAGQIGIAGANYGTSGQVLTSQGSSSAVQWATAPTWTQSSIFTKQSGLAIEFLNIPATAREIMIRFDGLSFRGNDELEFILGNSGGYNTSGYIVAAGYHPNENYVKRTSSIRFHGVGSAAYYVTGRLHLWYPVHGNLWWVEGVVFPHEPEGQYQHRVTGQADAGGTLTKIIAQGSAGNAFDNTGNGKIQISYRSY